MRFHCYGCGKSVTSELEAGAVLRAIAICPECLDRGVVAFAEPERLAGSRRAADAGVVEAPVDEGYEGPGPGSGGAGS